jgi:hypothetical protein
VALADISDVTTHLPLDRIPTVGSDVDGYQLSVERMVKGYLVGIFTPATLATWDTPTNTPVAIREIAGKLIAGLRYRNRTSEENAVGVEDINYGQRLYNEAMSALNDIRMGNLSLVDVTSGEVITTDDAVGPQFFPSDNAPMFTIGAQF